MALSKITYDTKVALNPQPDIANENKVTDSDMNEIKTIVNDAIDQVDTNTTDIAGLKGSILWTNSNPSTAISTTTINLSSSNYDILEVFYQHSTSNVRCYSQRILKGKETRLDAVYNVSGVYQSVFRDFLRTSDTQYSLGSATNISDNNAIIPLYVVGYKTGLFN